jgi:membrane-associated phospholipid phosphatase
VSRRLPHRQSVESERHKRSERVLLVAGFLLALGALLFFAWIAEEMLEGDTARFDSAVTSAIHAYSSAPLTNVMKALTMLGSSLVMGPLAILTLTVCYIRREFHALKTLAATFVGALMLEFLLKQAFQRQRPVPFFDLPTPGSFSFPSGHALFSFCFFGGIAAVLSPRLARRGAKLALWIVAAVLIAGIGLSRIYLGVHYPSDVLAGYAVGVVWVATVKFVNELHHKNVEREWKAA